ncbi:putative Cilia- and flagella-associated protein 45 [Blattamonas nauphoetae]|uniref:Cilia- and flagella-associated protein 45 n=1 Tax=Blattamonas nauphoetae TaxID=2049346 RepID=A0ABQ9YME8_9EUKA|nr:putative Cilia- and flagella-associated protein 45 [Blattamonas nauphoetae]
MATKTMTQKGGPNPKDPNVTILTRPELDRMRLLAKLREDPMVAERDMKNAANQRQREQAQMRKTRLLEKERERQMNPQLSDMDVLHSREHDIIVAAAKEQIDENTDEAKYMDSLMQHARAAAVRDKQRNERKTIKQRERDEEMAWGRLMEENRLNEIEKQEAKDRELAIQRREGAKVVVGQIQERRLEKQRERQEQEREAELRVQEMERQRLEEIEKQKEKAIRARKAQEEMAVENSRFKERKMMQRQQEIEEDLQVAKYLKEKAEREKAHEDEQARIKKEKELETARLRAMQEKIYDDRSKRDELAAKRAFDQKERQWRAQQKADAEKRAKNARELKEARDLQIASKRIMLEDAERKEREEFERIVETQKMEEMKERSFTQTRTMKGHSLGDDLAQQIEERRKQRIMAREKELNDGEDFTANERTRSERLERLKQKKIAQLRAEGVPDQYLVDLQKLKV